MNGRFRCCCPAKRLVTGSDPIVHSSVSCALTDIELVIAGSVGSRSYLEGIDRSLETGPITSISSFVTSSKT